jgi:WD40 repeat protein
MPLGADVPERPLTLDGKRVIGAALDAKLGCWDVSVYDGPTGKKPAAWTVAAPPRSSVHPALALSGDGKVLFGFDGDVVGRDPATGKETVRVKTGPVEMPGGTYFPVQVATSFDGTRIVVVQRNSEGPNRTLRVFDVKTGKELAAHDIGPAYFPALLFDRTGSRVAVYHNASQVLVCNAEGNAEPRKLDPGSVRSTCAAFSPNGASLAVGYEDGTALIWDLTAK